MAVVRRWQQALRAALRRVGERVNYQEPRSHSPFLYRLVLEEGAPIGLRPLPPFAQKDAALRKWGKTPPKRGAGAIRVRRG